MRKWLFSCVNSDFSPFKQRKPFDIECIIDLPSCEKDFVHWLQEYGLSLRCVFMLWQLVQSWVSLCDQVPHDCCNPYLSKKRFHGYYKTTKSSWNDSSCLLKITYHKKHQGTYYRHAHHFMMVKIHLYIKKFFLRYYRTRFASWKDSSWSLYHEKTL